MKSRITSSNGCHHISICAKVLGPHTDFHCSIYNLCSLKSVWYVAGNWVAPKTWEKAVMTETKCDGCQWGAPENGGGGKWQQKCFCLFSAQSLSEQLQSGDGVASSNTRRSSLRLSTRVLTPNRHHHTCPVVKMELVCVGTVEGVGDLAISSHVWIWCRNLQHKHAGGWVFHHRLSVHQLKHGDNNNN